MTDAVFKAILAMDSYNRGYNSGLELPLSNIQIGFAQVMYEDGGAAAQNANFYAVAYSTPDETIISYRGTDDLSLLNDVSGADFVNGWAIGAGFISDQAIRAVKFYQQVNDLVNSTGDYLTANISLTGHSLGGGLAGLIAGIYNKDATVFDNMPFEDAIDSLYTYANLFPSVAADVYGTGISPWATDFSGVDGYYVDGEMLTDTRTFSTFQPNLLSTYGAISPLNPLNMISLHSQSLLVSLLFGESLTDTAWKNAASYFVPNLTNAEIAGSLGWSDSVGGISSRGAKMATALAYSAIDISSDPLSGELLYGDTGIRSLYDDANDLGAVIAKISTDPGGVSASFDYDTKYLIGSVITNYAAALTYEKISRFGTEAQADRVDGVLTYDSDKGGLSLNLDPTMWEFGSGGHDVIAKSELLSHLFTTTGQTYSISNALNQYASWKGLNSAQASDLITTVNWDMNGLSNEIPIYHLGDGLNLVFTRENTGGYKDETGEHFNTFVFGSDASETIIGGNGDNILFGGDGDDTIVTGDDLSTLFDVNIIYSGAGNDLIAATRSSSISTGSGNDIIWLNRINNESRNIEIIDGSNSDSIIWNGHQISGGQWTVVEEETLTYVIWEEGFSYNWSIARAVQMDSLGIIYEYSLGEYTGSSGGYLQIYLPDKSGIVINDFHNGDMGITIDFGNEWDAITDSNTPRGEFANDGSIIGPDGNMLPYDVDLGPPDFSYVDTTWVVDAMEFSSTYASSLSNPGNYPVPAALEYLI